MVENGEAVFRNLTTINCTASNKDAIGDVIDDITKGDAITSDQVESALTVLGNVIDEDISEEVMYKY